MRPARRAVYAITVILVAATPPARADGTEVNLTDAVGQLYTEVRSRCTRDMAPNFQAIQLTGNDEGRIIDTDSRLGDPFHYKSGPPVLWIYPALPISAHRLSRTATGT